MLNTILDGDHHHTYSDGKNPSKRIDYILCDPDLSNSAHTCYVNYKWERYKGKRHKSKLPKNAVITDDVHDHYPLFVTIQGG